MNWKYWKYSHIWNKKKEEQFDQNIGEKVKNEWKKLRDDTQNDHKELEKDQLEKQDATVTVVKKNLKSFIKWSNL